MKLHLDFETRSPVNLKTSGVYKYAEHPQTSILCVGYAFDDGPTDVTSPVELLPWLTDHIKEGALVVAHNSPFELTIWNKVGVRDHGWPALRPEQTDCTMARAYSMSLPGSLDNAAAAVGIETRKDMKGHRLMLKLSQPREVVPGGCKVCEGDGTGVDLVGKCPWCLGTGEGYVWWEDAADFERLFAYCAQDIEVGRALDKRLLALSTNEKKLWLVDFAINSRGIHVDVDNATKALRLVEHESKRLDETVREVTGNAVASCKAHVQLRKWLGEQGVATEGVAKDDVIQLLAREDLPVGARRALEVRQEAAKSSTAKLKSMLAGADSERRLRGMFQFCGAGRTGRFSGRRVQLQNMPRPVGMKQQQIEEVLRWLANLPLEEVRDRIEILYGSPMSVIASCLRAFLCARPGYDLIAVDFSAIEARVIAWLAGEWSVLEIFRTHGKIYEKAASEVFGVRLEDITKEDWRRMIGKVSVLALGFGGGVGAFQTMAKAYNVRMEPAFQALWNRADADMRDRALERCKKEHKKAGISEKEWLASELTKLFWRESHPAIVRYWYNLEAAAVNAVRNPGDVSQVTPLNLPPVKFRTRGSFLFCQLPSGRALCYPYPKVERIKTAWGQEKETLTYMEDDSTTGKWRRQKTYGGKLAENVTQAVARDLLVHGMLRTESMGHQIVLHVHDEIVVEVPQDTGEDLLPDLEKLVSTNPEWTKGLPIGAEGWRGKRYRK